MVGRRQSFAFVREDGPNGKIHKRWPRTRSRSSSARGTVARGTWPEVVVDQRRAAATPLLKLGSDDDGSAQVSVAAPTPAVENIESCVAPHKWKPTDDGDEISVARWKRKSSLSFDTHPSLLLIGGPHLIAYL